MIAPFFYFKAMSTLQQTSKEIQKIIEITYEDLKVNRSTKHGIITSLKMTFNIMLELEPYSKNEKIFILNNVEQNLKI